MVVSLGVLENNRVTNGKEVKGSITFSRTSKVHHQQNWTIGEGKTHNHHRAWPKSTGR